MKRSSAIILASLAGFLVVVYLAAHRSSRRYDETLSFAQQLKESLHQDERFALLRVQPSTANTIDIMGPVANSNVMAELKMEVLSLEPPVPTLARLYVVNSTSPAPEHVGKIVTWIIYP